MLKDAKIKGYDDHYTIRFTGPARDHTVRVATFDLVIRALKHWYSKAHNGVDCPLCDQGELPRGAIRWAVIDAEM